jgi:poly-gamma-glutamate synthesis protein (capsule biosynthesis protein)
VRLKLTGDWLPKSPLHLDEGALCIGNLECAFSDGVIETGKAYISLVPLSYIDNVSSSAFIALSLANNHVYDAVVDAVVSMRQNLERKCPNVQFFGTKDRPYAIVETDGKRVAVIGSLESCRSRGKDIFSEEDVEALMREIRGRFDAVYVYPHWGKEGEYTRWPSPQQRKLARRWIDAGADGVFGSHSHVFQGREYYKGKPIYYSLGNFFFPHPESRLYKGAHDGLMVDIDEGRIVERFHHYEDDGSISAGQDFSGLMEEISEPLKRWSTWKWAKAVGPFNVKKNTASWRIRLKKNFIKTLPKFLVWQVLPQTLLFRVASAFGK